MVYYAQVDSRIRYGVCFWGASVAAGDVLLCQKKVVRSILGVPYTTSCRSLFVSLRILTVVNVLIMEMALYIFKNKSKFLLNSDCHRFNTRNKNNYRMPLNRLNICKNMPNSLGLKIFNALPDSLKLIHCFNLFKGKLRSFLMENPFYSLDEYFDFV